MAKRSTLLGGAQIKVENMSGFDKSRFNAFTAPLGSIVPMAKQLLIPGKFDLRVKISAQLPPLATDAFLRTHLKVEAFVVPLRQCYGGFQSWFAGEQIYISGADPSASTLGQAKLPYARVSWDGDPANYDNDRAKFIFGPHSLMDYFGVKWPLSSGVPSRTVWPQTGSPLAPIPQDFNIFPFVAYQLIYHHWYRNKLIQRPLFCPPDAGSGVGGAFCLPYESFANRTKFEYKIHTTYDDGKLLNGTLWDLRQRNYGYDYFTSALPSAQEGSPMTVDTSSGSFSIASLRISNTLQHFAEINQLASADYVGVCRARYGKAPSSSVASRPILVGSADFPMFTSGVEQTSADPASVANNNPFSGIAARYGRAHAEGSDFVCHCEVDEPSYLMVMCSVVPEANYAVGIAHDMRIFTQEGSITDLPNAQLELAGLDPVACEELSTPLAVVDGGYVFGYHPRFMWHKAGPGNEVHGLFRQGASLEAFIPQRFAGVQLPISSAFLQVAKTDLDNVTAVQSAISNYGVMIDSSIELFVSEPLSEGKLPALADPASEHGHSVYVKRGGLSV